MRATAIARALRIGSTCEAEIPAAGLGSSAPDGSSAPPCGRKELRFNVLPATCAHIYSDARAESIGSRGRSGKKNIASLAFQRIRELAHRSHVGLADLPGGIAGSQ